MLTMRENKTKTPTEGPSPADRAAARALWGRGIYTPEEIKIMDRGAPRPEEAVSDGIDLWLRQGAMKRQTINPSVDGEKQEIDQAVEREFGLDLAKAEEAVAAAVARTGAVVEKVYASAPRIDPSARGGGRWFSVDEVPPDLRDELRDVRQAEASARVSLSRLNERIEARRRALAAERAPRRT